MKIHPIIFVMGALVISIIVVLVLRDGETTIAPDEVDNQPAQSTDMPTMENTDGIHIMGDGSVMAGDGTVLNGAVVLENGNIRLADGSVIEPIMDMR